MSKVINDTKVTRPTLTAIVQNNGKGIQFETLNTLCNYLNVTPCEFFSYIPYDFEYNVLDFEEKHSNNENWIGVKFDFFITIKDKKGVLVNSFSFTCVGNLVFEGVVLDTEINHLTFNFSTSDSDFDELSRFFDKLDPSWIYTVRDDVKQFFMKYFAKQANSVDTKHVDDFFDTLSIL
ncbi:helix-turn-helix transcriptional regulator [Aerococcaceae bacterium NML191219]|nr:helix-turn-helix transcriptional regulator [Aerococcaceae bacterium NML191219]